MRRNKSKPLVPKGSTSLENIPPNVSDKSEKKGFFGRLFSKKDESKKIKQTAATTTRRRRKSKLAKESVEDDGDAITKEIIQAQTNIQKLETEIASDLIELVGLQQNGIIEFDQSNYISDSENTFESEQSTINTESEQPSSILPPPPPPPPPPPSTSLLHPSQSPKNPTNQLNRADFLSEIRNMDKSKLKSTGVRRSIGGTPIKEKKQYAMTGEAEIFASIVIRDSSSSYEESDESSDEGF
ncbi:WH2 motif family protein [Histomonas meleagridis]|uniref:WH2 motif family protein n=1 Tax=Histomonas meleagridis TaxID=135588 RepID=UPI00355AB976|nr:WH2 motif family protein [Histomonas meleagridis]KAH0803028.1 WH2 motif family protein [Histomonas meleagridis]